MKITRDKGIIESASAPTSADVYRLGTIWVDTTNDISYTLTDVTAGSATWLKTAGIGSGEIDFEGDYLLNEQTTTNMMSKGTVYRFDGVDDVITVTDNAEIQNIFDGGGSVSAKIYPLSDGEGDQARIVEKNGAWWLQLFSETAGYVKIRFVQPFSGSAGVWTTTAFPLNDWADISINYDNSLVTNDPVVYINGVPVALTEDATPTGTRTTDVGANLLIGNNTGGLRTFDGEIAEVMLGNFSPSENEVKDLISGNIPFKWQWGSQTDKVVSAIAEHAGNGFDTFSGASADGFTAVYSTAGTQIATTADEITLVAGKEYRISFDATLTSGTYPATKIRETATSGTLQTLIAAGGATTGSQSFDYTSTATGTYVITWEAVADVSFAIANLTFVELGAVALYDQTSMSPTHWGDKANSNDGAVTGCDLLNQPDAMSMLSVVLTPSAQDATPKEGQLIYNSATNKLNVWTGAAWEVVTSA